MFGIGRLCGAALAVERVGGTSASACGGVRWGAGGGGFLARARAREVRVRGLKIHSEGVDKLRGVDRVDTWTGGLGQNLNPYEGDLITPGSYIYVCKFIF